MVVASLILAVLALALGVPGALLACLQLRDRRRTQNPARMIPEGPLPGQISVTLIICEQLIAPTGGPPPSGAEQDPLDPLVDEQQSGSVSAVVSVKEGEQTA